MSEKTKKDYNEYVSECLAKQVAECRADADCIEITPENMPKIFEALANHKALHIVDEVPFPHDQPPYNILAKTEAMYTPKYLYLFDGEAEQCTEDRITEILSYAGEWDESLSLPTFVKVLPYSKFVDEYKEIIAYQIEDMESHC
jgi:hypothetical protein